MAVLLALLLATTVLMGAAPTEQPWSGALPITDISNPGYLETVSDSPYGVSVTRVSDEEVFGRSGAGIQHQYSKVQAWNADMSLLKLGSWYILDGEDYSLKSTIDVTQTDSRWSNVDPDIMYYGDGEALKRLDISTGEETVLQEFPGFGRVTIGPWEGNLTADDRYVVVTSIDLSQAAVYDIAADELLSTRSFPATFDWVSMDPWGDFVVVSHNGKNDTRLYDLDFEFVRVLSEFQSHADFAIDSDGSKVLVEMCPLRMTRIADGVQTDLLPPTEQTACDCREPANDPWVCGHVSTRSFKMPGWALVSAGTDECNDGAGGYCNRTEIFFVKLDGSGTIRPLGHSRSDFADYEAQAKAVVSPDGSKVLFTSNWNIDGEGGDTLDYVIELDSAP